MQWITISAVPLETLCSLQPIIEYLAGGSEHKVRAAVSPELQDILERMINVVFGTNTLRHTADSSRIEVKRSDRWAYSSLCWRKVICVFTVSFCICSKIF